MANPSIITNRPIIFDTEGKVSRISSGGTVEVGKITGVDDLDLTPGYGCYLHAITRDGYLSIDGYSTSSFLGLNNVVGLSLRATTQATIGNQHRNPPTVNAVGQYYIGGTSVHRYLGKIGMLATDIDGGGEITKYTFAWSDNSNNIKWQVNNLGDVYQEGNLTFDPSYDALIQDVKRINGATGIDFIIGYDAVDKIVLTDSDIKILNNDGEAYLQINNDGDLLLRSKLDTNIWLSNEDLSPTTYSSMIFNWNTSVKISNFDAMSFLLSSSEGDGSGSKAARMYFLNELVFDTEDYNPNGGDIKIETNLRANSVLSSLNAIGGNIMLRTGVDNSSIINGVAGKILLESNNTDIGIDDFGFDIKSGGSIRNYLGDANTDSAHTSSLFVIKKDVSVDSAGVRMIALQTQASEDFAEIIFADNFNDLTPAPMGSFALDKNAGKAWIRTGPKWERLATTETMTRAESVFVNILFDIVNTPTYGDVVIIGGEYDGYGTVVPAIANQQLPDIAGIAADETDYVQVEGIAVAKVETGISILEGEKVYLSDIEEGAITNIPPDNVGSTIISLGLAVDDSDSGYCRILLNKGESIFVDGYSGSYVLGIGNFDLHKGVAVDSTGVATVIGATWIDASVWSVSRVVKFRCILESTSILSTYAAVVDLFDTEGNLGITPAPVVGSQMDNTGVTNPLMATMVEVDVSAAFDGFSGSGVFEARLWIATLGGGNSVTCKSAQIILE